MNPKKIAFLFPGQGSQAVGMGKDFYEAFPSARRVFEQGDDLLERFLSKIIFEGPLETLTETRNSQAAIYITSLAITEVLKEQFPELKPSMCAGMSLGEYTALTASERIPLETCLPLVQFRGEVMNAACEATQGGMAALFGLASNEVEALIKSLNAPNDVWVANFNCPGQTVISGTLKGVEMGIAAAKEKGAKRAIPLKVHGAFHSGLMHLAEERLAPRIEQLTIRPSNIRLVMNFSGQFVDDEDAIRSQMIQQVTSPVRWEQSIRTMMPEADLYIEIGGKILASMNNQIGVLFPTLTVNTVKELERIYEQIANG